MPIQVHLAPPPCFDHHRNVDADPDIRLAAVAAAIAEPARARMLCLLMDGRARTATELATAAEIAASTASSHLSRLKQAALVDATAQGKHRYFKLAGPEVAAALEALQVLGGGPRRAFRPTTPDHLRRARSCYDHAAGEIAVTVHDRIVAAAWLVPDQDGYALSERGERALTRLGVDCERARSARRRFAYACLDWSERRAHLAGALGAALLEFMLEKRWLVRDLDSRALRVTDLGEQCLAKLAR